MNLFKTKVNERGKRHTNTTIATTTTTPTEFQSLDTIIEKARKQQMLMLFPIELRHFSINHYFKYPFYNQKMYYPMS